MIDQIKMYVEIDSHKEALVLHIEPFLNHRILLPVVLCVITISKCNDYHKCFVGNYIDHRKFLVSNYDNFQIFFFG